MSDIVVFIVNYFMKNVYKTIVAVNDQNTVNVIRGHDLWNEFLFLCCSKLTIVNGANNRIVVIDVFTGIMYVLVMKYGNGYICIVQNNPYPRLLWNMHSLQTVDSQR